MPSNLVAGAGSAFLSVLLSIRHPSGVSNIAPPFHCPLKPGNNSTRGALEPVAANEGDPTAPEQGRQAPSGDVSPAARREWSC